MDVLTTIAAFIGILVVLVLVHELGHFAMAKWAGKRSRSSGSAFRRASHR